MNNIISKNKQKPKREENSNHPKNENEKRKPKTRAVKSRLTLDSH